MADQVTAATPALEAAAKQAQNTGDEIAGQFSRLMGALEPLESQFKGLAGTAFQEAKQNAHTDLMKIVNALNTLAASVNKTGVTFATTDQQSEAEIRKVVSQSGVSGGIANLLEG